jgi:predicted adenine nucleotide alpha hydrolase (AANH) superfamily ATPase
VFFSNANIYPLAEYELRRGELLRHATQLGQKASGSNQEAASSRQEATGSNQKATSSGQEPRGLVVIDDVYDHEAWRCAVRGLECEPERGQRCLQCFRFRLERAARYAHEHGFNVLTTTLASSRWKDLEQVDAAGAYACSLFPGLRWWGRNWRKGGLQERRSAIIREQNFYNQTWCGCEFSHHDKTNEPTCPLPVEAPSR